LRPGAINDPSAQSPFAFQFTNLQAVGSLFMSSSARVDTTTYAVVGLLFLCWLWTVNRHGLDEEQAWVALAAIVSLGLLPVYHREYDLTLLVFSIPGLLVFVRKSWIGWLALIWTVFLFIPPHMHHQWSKMDDSSPFIHPIGTSFMHTVLFERYQPLVLLGLACSYLIALTLPPATQRLDPGFASAGGE
jgi:hypothetical protein